MKISPQNPSLRMLVYTSASRQNWSVAELEALAVHAQGRNLELGITGQLMFLDGRFFQILEGPGQGPLDLYRRIRRDPRHQDALLLHEAAIAERAFQDTAMAVMNAADLSQAQMEWLLRGGAAAASSPKRTWGGMLRGLDAAESGTGPRVMPQQGRAHATVERLLESARAVMLRDGLAAATIPSIATEANVSLNTAYRYFASTDQVFSAMVRRWQTRKLSAFALRLGDLAFTGIEDIAREISDHISQTYLANDLVPLKIREAALRDHHHIAYDVLWNLAEIILQTLRHNGLPCDDPTQRARIAMALAGLGAQAKMAALHAPAELRTAASRASMASILVAAMRPQA